MHLKTIVIIVDVLRAQLKAYLSKWCDERSGDNQPRPTVADRQMWTRFLPAVQHPISMLFTTLRALVLLSVIADFDALTQNSPQFKEELEVGSSSDGSANRSLQVRSCSEAT
jgi:hypothetical protein